MKTLLLTALVGGCSFSPARATDYYVSSQIGHNTTADSTGLSAANPFLTIQYAADLAQSPGDVVYIRAGTYTGGSSVLYVKYSGSASAPITFRNYPGDAKPLLQFSSWYGVYIGEDVTRPGSGVSYIEIIGLRLQGNNRNITLADATNQPNSCANPTGGYDGRYSGSGIAVKGTATVHPHHLRMAENEVFECPGGGIGSARADYITIENNVVYNCAWYSSSGGSGISVLGCWDFDTRTDIYRTIIRNNVAFGNQLLVPWFTGGVCKGFTDGNGIIVDSNRNFGYTGRTLIANNLVVDNGGAGITFFQSDHGDLINNTLYHNVKTSTNNGGDLVVAYAADVLVQNNIAVAATKYAALVKYSNNVTFNANLFYGGTGVTLTNNNTGAIPNTNVVSADPQFVNPGTDPFASDFALQAGSPALDQGVNNKLSVPDLAGNPRVAGCAPDLGAYERPALPPGGPLRAPEQPVYAVAGLDYKYYTDPAGSWTALPDFNALSYAASGTAATFSLSPATQDTRFAFVYTGYVSVPTDGEYVFFTTSNDGSQLRIGNQLVVDNDGLHPSQEQSGAIGLQAGQHAITVAYFQQGGDRSLAVSYQGPCVAKQAVPDAALFRDAASPRPALAAVSGAAKRPPVLVAYPNPMADRATLRYVTARAGAVRLDVLDALGRLVARLVDGEQPAGPHEVEFVAPAAGLYHVRLATPDGRAQQTLTPLR